MNSEGNTRSWLTLTVESCCQSWRQYNWKLVLFVTVINLTLSGLSTWIAGDMKSLEMWHRIEAFALGTTVCSVIFGLFLFVRDAWPDKTDDGMKVLVSSSLVFLWVIIFAALCLVNMKREILHAIFFTLIFFGLFFYELALSSCLSNKESKVIKKLDEVRKYCDFPASFAFSILVLFLCAMYLFEHKGIGTFAGVNVVPAIAAGAFGLHALLTSLIAIVQFSRQD